MSGNRVGSLRPYGLLSCVGDIPIIISHHSSLNLAWFIVPFYHRNNHRLITIDPSCNRCRLGHRWEVARASSSLSHLGRDRSRPERLSSAGTNWGLWPWTERQNHDVIDPLSRCSGLCAMLKWLCLCIDLHQSDFVVNSAKMLMICWPRCCVFVFEPTVLSEICWMHFLGPDSHCVKICDHCSHHHKAFGLTQVPIQIATKQNVQKLQRWNGLIL